MTLALFSLLCAWSQVKCARDITFDYGETMGITEDLHIFLRALSKGYKVSHVEGIVRTGVPKEVQIMVDQRRRWAVGYLLHIASSNVGLRNMDISKKPVFILCFHVNTGTNEPETHSCCIFLGNVDLSMYLLAASLHFPRGSILAFLVYDGIRRYNIPGNLADCVQDRGSDIS